MSELPIAARIAVWAACKSPTRHIRSDCLGNASYTALHYGLGGALPEWSLNNIVFRAAVILGQTLRRAGSA